MKSRSWTILALGALTALSGAPVSADTQAECSQEYTAKKAAGETGGQSQADYVKACLARPKTAADSEPGGTTGDADTELAKKTENPIADLISVPFNNYATFNYGPNGHGRGTFDLLEIQPVIPIHLTPDWNVITRTVLPVVWTPDLSPVPTVSVGIAPTDFSAFLTPSKETNGILWGVGPVVQIPTITSSDLGSNMCGGGPTAVVVWTHDKIVAGALANTIWSFGGTRGPAATATTPRSSSRSSTTISGTAGTSTATRTSSRTGRPSEPSGRFRLAAAPGGSSVSASCRSNFRPASSTMSCSRLTAGAGC